VGFRRFPGLAEPTTPTQPEDPPATGGYGTGQIAELTTQDEALPISLVEDDKKVVAGSVEVPRQERFTVESKKATAPPRSRSGYVWVSERSRGSRAGWADFVNRAF
jgi:hypothetical protein